MKKYYTFLLFLLIVFGCKSLVSQRNNKYLIAMNYLIKNKYFKEKELNIVDTLIYIPQILDFDKLTIDKDSKEYFRLQDSLKGIDDKFYHKNIFYKFSSYNKFIKFKGGANNVYFSKPIQNTYYLQIINNRNNPKSSNKKLSLFGTTDFYKLKFNDKDEIIEFKKVEYISN